MKYALGIGKYENTLKSYRAFTSGRFTNNFPEDLSDCAGVIFTGSEANIHDEDRPEYKKMSSALIEFIEKVRAEGLPIAGLCFGSQALNHSFGSEVDWIYDDNHDNGEVGAVKLSLTEEGRENDLFKYLTDDEKKNLYINASHAQHVKKESMPDELVLLASSDISEVHITALKHDHSILSIQGHPETTDVWVDMASDTGEKPGQFKDPNLFQGLTEPISEALFRKFLYMVKDTAQKNKTA
jgi:GMP synthase-like glutamine amidotransferase